MHMPMLLLETQRAWFYAVKSGVGIGPLPTAIADGESDLVQVLAAIPELARAAVFRLGLQENACHRFLIEERDTSN